MHPDVVFVVGEGYAPVERKAKLETLLTDEALLRGRPDFAAYPVLAGSSSGRKLGLTHVIFGARSFGTNAHVRLTNHALIRRVAEAKAAGKRVVIMELKPVNDSYMLLRAVGHLLTPDDFVLFSGSYNFREADVSFGQLQQLLNKGGRYRRVLFETWPSLRRGHFPGEMPSVYGSTSPISRALVHARGKMLVDTSAPGVDHEETIDDWNIAVSADCIQSVAVQLWDAGIGNRAIARTVAERIGEMYLTSMAPVDELNDWQMGRLLNAVFGIRSGGEFDDRSAELTNLLEHRLVEEQFEAFKRNWNVAMKIRHDRKELLIGDGILPAWAHDTSLMRVEAGSVDFDNPSRYSRFTALQGAQQDTGFLMMTGVAKPFDLVRTFASITTERHHGIAL